MTPWIVAHQDALSVGFPRQEYWSGFPFSFPRGLPNPEIEPKTPVLVGRFLTTELPGKPLAYYHYQIQEKKENFLRSF